jgi:hypothetical protein
MGFEAYNVVYAGHGSRAVLDRSDAGIVGSNRI